VVTKLVLLVIVSYLLGSVPVTYLAGKWARGIDLRRYGSGNIGATNLLHTTSRRVMVPAAVFDFSKGIVMVLAAQAIGLGTAGQVMVGLAAIMGHNWSVFLRFSGGRGMLTTLGVALTLPIINGLVPWEATAGLVMTAIGLLALHNLPLGVIVGVAVLPLISWGVGKPLALTLGFLAIFVIAVIKRLAAPRASIAASISTRELLVNRLLFDRDIRDRETWINRIVPEASPSPTPEKVDPAK